METKILTNALVFMIFLCTCNAKHGISLSNQELTSAALQIFKNISSVGSGLQLSADCTSVVFSAAFRQKAIYYLDALGKPGSGYLQGNFVWRGSYDECKSIPDSHYCLTQPQLSLSNQSKAMLGICAPIQCNADDIISLFGYVTNMLKISKMIYIQKDGGFAKLYGKNMVCPPKQGYTAGAKGTLAFIGVILFLCFVGTVAEIMKDLLSTDHPTMKSNGFMPVRSPPLKIEGSSGDEEEGDHLNSDMQPLIKSRRNVGHILIDFMLSFSLIKNIKMVMDTNVPKGAITSLNGIRVLSMWWVVLSHLESQWVSPASPAADNAVTAGKILNRFTFLPIANGFFSVDSFFVLSGVLVSYLSLRRCEKYGSLPLLQFYVHRFLRLTPVYMFVILFYTYILPLMGDGPFWSLSLSGATQGCKDYWWTNLLYINNFYPVDPSKSCINWTWYLANDMQFYIISPIFIIAMYKWKIVGGLATLLPVLAASFIATGVIMGYYNLSPFIIAALADGGKTFGLFMKYVYFKPYCRIMPYLVGLFAGYVFHKDMRLRGRWKWLFAMIGWAVAVVIGLLLTYGTYPYFKVGGQLPSEGVNIAYGVFSRYVWGLALSWVIYACHFKFGGYINSILSWRGFIPLSRLTYGVYMIHLIVLMIFVYSRNLPFHFTDMHIAIYFMATICASYAGAFVLAVCVEMPCFNLEKLVFKF